MNAQLLIIGDEILIGQVLDTNSNWMAQQLNLNGIRVLEIHAVSDTREAILGGLNRALEQADLVLMTGGLGPTKDDITKKTLAQYFGMDMAFHQESWENLQELLAKFNRVAGDEYRWQCDMPVGATILRNRQGTAPGMVFERDGKVVVSMPGVPWEMKHLMETGVLPLLKAKYKQSPIVHKTIQTVGVGETQLAGWIEDFENNLPAHVKLAYLPSLGAVRLRLTARGENEQDLKQELETLATQLQPLIGEHIFAYKDISLEEAVGELLKSRNETLSLAESCTGGYIAHKITSIAGSSSYFMGGVVSYSNAAKQEMLGVKNETLSEFGAVSEPVVREMAKGALARFHTTYAIAVSGVAGPDGGTPDKPVGTVCIAVVSKDKEDVKTVKFGRDRLQNIQLTTTVALNLLRKMMVP